MGWIYGRDEDGNPLARVKEFIDYAEAVADVVEARGNCPLGGDFKLADCECMESCQLDRERRKPGVCDQCDYVMGWN